YDRNKWPVHDLVFPSFQKPDPALDIEFQCNSVNASPWPAKLLQCRTMTTPKVLIADSISQSGIDELARDGALEVSTQTGLSESALAEIIPDFTAVVVRSQTKIT